MKKMRKTVGVLLIAVLFMVCFQGTGLKPVSAAETKTIDSVPMFHSVYEFKSYIDNADAGKNKPVAHEMINAGIGASGNIYKFTAPADGQLVIFTFERSGRVYGKVFSDSTCSEMLCSNNAVSTRGKVSQTEVTGGTEYYLQQVRWTGDTRIDADYATTYIGVIPNSSAGVPFTPVSANYDSKVDTVVSEVSSAGEFKSMVPSLEKKADYVRGNVGTYSEDIHCFRIDKTGWLLTLFYSDKTNGLEVTVCSDESMSSKIIEGTGSVDDEPEKVWVEPGTYYYRAFRNDGYSKNIWESPIYSCFGFVPLNGQISAGKTVLSADKKSAEISFQVPSGVKAQVRDGYADPGIIEDEEFWNEVPEIDPVGYKVTENGSYVARMLDSTTGLHFMAAIEVTGIVKEVIPEPTISVAKKNMTVMRGKKKKIKYKTKHYSGEVFFKSQNNRIAKVTKKGVVKGLTKGKCKITVSISTGAQAVVTVRVK